MPQTLDYLKETASQTAGPYVHIGLAPGAAGFDIYKRELGWDIAGPDAKGERIRVEGVVIDGMGAPIKDVMIEVWQANAAGPVLNLIEWEHRRETLVAARNDEGKVPTYRFEIHLQGEDETVFFDV